MGGETGEVPLWRKWARAGWVCVRALALFVVSGFLVWVMVPLGLVVWPVLAVVHWLRTRQDSSGPISPKQSIGYVVGGQLYIVAFGLGLAPELFPAGRPKLGEHSFGLRDFAQLAA
ncbi:MAG: hypothetical protein GY939_14085 [Actinomycetia bacterium]|nr:hypothetical protein [Actinomycetes bacterium]